MKDFLKDKTWEDFLIYGLGILMIIGLLFFVIGFLTGFKIDSVIPSYEQSTSIAGILKGGVVGFKDVDTTNLFTLMGDLTQGTKAYQMCALSISGFAFIMLDIFIILVIFIWTAITGWIIPKIKAKKNA